MGTRHDLTIDELAEAVGVPVRTVRFYISEGLLPGPGARGKGAAYGEEHLLRLRLIRRLVEQRVPLADIRARVSGLALDEVRALLAEEDQRAAELARVAAERSPQAYVSTLLSRARGAREEPPAPPVVAYRLPARAYDAAPPPAPPAPPDTWRRVELAPGVELHIRADAEDAQEDLIDRLLRAARQERTERPR